MKIQIAGPGCPKCEMTEKHVRQACSELGLDVEVEHLTDPREMAMLGVMLTPAVIVDGKVIEAGHVPTTENIKVKIGALAD